MCHIQSMSWQLGLWTWAGIRLLLFKWQENSLHNKNPKLTFLPYLFPFPSFLPKIFYFILNALLLSLHTGRLTVFSLALYYIFLITVFYHQSFLSQEAYHYVHYCQKHFLWSLIFWCLLAGQSQLFCDMFSINLKTLKMLSYVWCLGFLFSIHHCFPVLQGTLQHFPLYACLWDFFQGNNEEECKTSRKKQTWRTIMFAMAVLGLRDLSWE